MRNVLLRLENTAAVQQVILEIFTHFCRVDDGLDTVLAQLRVVTNAAEHQELGCIDATRAKNDFCSSPHHTLGAPAIDLHTCDLVAR